MCYRCNKEKSRFALGLVIGGMAAGITALLYAPMKGDKMRKELCKKCDHMKKRALDAEHDIEEVAGEFSSHTRKLAKKLKKRLWG